MTDPPENKPELPKFKLAQPARAMPGNNQPANSAPPGAPPKAAVATAVRVPVPPSAQKGVPAKSAPVPAPPKSGPAQPGAAEEKPNLANQASAANAGTNGQASPPVPPAALGVAPDDKILPNTGNPLDNSANPKTGRSFLSGSSENSAKNAIKHGLTATCILADESIDEFEALRQRLLKQYSTQDPLEEMCIERILMCHWRLRRMWRVEAESMNNLQQKKSSDDPDSPVDNTALGVSVREELNTCVSFESLQRYEAAIERQLRRAIGELLLMRKIIPNLEKGEGKIIAMQKLLS